MRTRRGFLAFLTVCGAASTGTLAGCATKNTRSHSPDDALRVRAAASARTLAACYQAALGGASVDDAMATLYRSHHLAHTQRLTNGASANATPMPIAAAANASPTASTSPPTRQDLAADERTASGTSLADVNHASGALAALLASIGTCRTLHAQSLDPLDPAQASALDAASADTPPPLSTAKASPAEPLQPMLSAEYAMVYAYGALGPHLTGSQRAAAHAAFDLHRSQRDVLVTAIGARGSSPRAAEASYDLPFRVIDAASASRLAALVETRLAAVCAQTVSASSGPGGDRAYAAWALTQAALRAQTWGAPVTAFPGLDADA
jgi:hypothetical protein